MNGRDFLARFRDDPAFVADLAEGVDREKLNKQLWHLFAEFEFEEYDPEKMIAFINHLESIIIITSSSSRSGDYYAVVVATNTRPAIGCRQLLKPSDAVTTDHPN